MLNTRLYVSDLVVFFFGLIVIVMLLRPLAGNAMVVSPKLTKHFTLAT